MSSSILSGERRWASARRGGMTVLGKVAVPKPINLPSQRLENHGLDPNVEIVPKGTHGWGSKSSSSSSNAWGSPNTDGGTGSPSYLSGRPSSGGDGTRPSTAGSDRVRDPVPNAWGSNSRPSSSSGVLTPNQTAQTALRPRSADTRPGSSQLSRFAEPSSDNSGAWGGSGTSEKLSGTSSKNDVFSLTTGDFPSLGSEKDYSRKNVDSQDHGSNGRPGSSSSGVTAVKGHTGDSGDDFSVNANTKPGGSWRKESSMHVEDGNRSNVEKWHSDRQPYPNSNIHHPQHFDAWHGPPVNNHPGGGWFRGPPGGPPFGSPVPPGGFPMEPFPYFHPQMPPPLANAPPGHPHNTAPRGSHPKNGDMYRTHMHDPYVRPSMPLRPGFYPGPGPLPYDYYGPPPMGFCNSNDRDVPFMGMPMRPGIYNSYPGHNAADPDNSIERTSGYGPTGNSMGSEKGEAVHPQDARGPYKVLLKQHESWEGRDREHKWDENAETNSSHSLKREPPKKSSWDNGWKTDDEMDARKLKHGEGTSSEAVDDRAVPMKVKSPEIVASRNLSDDGSVKKFGHAASNVPEVVASKDSSLIQKIEGLNAKARASDVRQDVKPVSTREGQKNRLQVGNMIGNEADSASFSHEKAHTSGIISSVPREDHFGPREKRFEPTVVGVASTIRKSSHGKVDHHGKMRFNNQEADGWHKKTNVLETNAPASTGHSEVSHTSHGKDDRDSMPHDSDVNESQRAKMMELTKRIKQREKEEEERTRDQRAKALAKLEELNRRTQSVETVADKLDTVPSTAAPSGTEIKVGPLSLSLSSNTNTVHEKEKVETVASSAVHKKLEDPSISAPPTPALATNATICFGSIGDEIVTNLATNLSINPGAPSESSAHHKKKSKSGKNRQKAEEAPSKEPDESSGESARPKTSEAVSVQSMTNMTDSNQSSDLHPPLVNEGYVRSNNQGKSQHPRRMTRGQQGTKSDKSHGTDAVVWAPVRSQNKIEVSDESAQNVSSVTASQNNPKSKRAEMERYVPKPAAKELSNQGGNNQANVPNKKIPSNEATDRHESGTVGIESSETSTAASVKLGPTVEPKSGDVRRNRSGKVHGSWRQRGMAESSTNPTPYPNSYPSTNPQKPVEDHQDPNEWNDGWNMPEPPEPAVNVSVPKDQGAVARGKRHQHKGYKGTGHNHNPDEKRNVATDPSKTSMQPAASEVNRSDSPNHAVGERSAAHWQPKTQSLPATGGGRANKRESSSRGQQFLYEKTNLEESSDVERHHGPRGERQKVGHRGRPVSPVEVGSQPNVNVHPDRPISSGSRRNGNGNSRHNVHFEYQPVGPQNNRSNFEPPKERRHNAGSRYRERGQGQPRRGGGNFSGRQSGGVQVDGGYDE